MAKQQAIKMCYLRNKSRHRNTVGEESVMRISHLRGSLGWACQEVAKTDEPIIVKRYKTQDVAIVPLWEWQFFMQLEAQIKAGCCPVGREQGEACPCSLNK